MSRAMQYTKRYAVQYSVPFTGQYITLIAECR